MYVIEFGRIDSECIFLIILILKLSKSQEQITKLSNQLIVTDSSFQAQLNDKLLVIEKLREESDSKTKRVCYISYLVILDLKSFEISVNKYFCFSIDRAVD